MTVYQNGSRVRVDIPPGPDEAAGDRLTAIHSVLLHIAASIVLDHPRFLQAVIATVILSLVMGVVGLSALPPLLGFPVLLFATFAGLKISYGASVPRTLGQVVVSGLIALMLAFLDRTFT